MQNTERRFTQKKIAAPVTAIPATTKKVTEEMVKHNVAANHIQLSEATPNATAIEKVNNAAAPAAANHQIVTQTQQGNGKYAFKSCC